MPSWRKSLMAFGCLALATTPAAAQYYPAQPQPYAVPARPYSQTLQPQPVPAPAATPSYVVGPSDASPGAVLAAALESNRRRDLIGTLSYRERLSDPVARKIVTWAMVDVFGDRLGLSELETAGRDLQGWPRAEAREKALERARNGGIATPGGPVPTAACRRRPAARTRPPPACSASAVSACRRRSGAATQPPPTWP